MTDRSFVSGSIAELLAAVASGVRDAQEALSAAPPLDAAGRPVPGYQLPYVDFEFRVNLETRRTEAGLPVMYASPVSAETASISSVVSGRLVAVPPGDGRPLPVLELTAERLSARRHRLRVVAANSAGELLGGAPVELNFDLAASRQLSQAGGTALAGLRSSSFDAAVLLTDADGRAETVLSIDSGVAAAAMIVVTAEFGPATARLAVRAGAD
ncbi:MAG: hypothetical protein ACXIUV_02410 [Alkalilacustris sp.]